MKKLWIRYHPLIDGDSEGLEKVPLFLTTDKAAVSERNRLYLSEMIPNYFTLHSREPMSQKTTDSFNIHCPSCGKVLKRISANTDTHNLGMYTCICCKR